MKTIVAGRNLVVTLTKFFAAIGVLGAMVQAQSTQGPQAYSLTEINAMFGPAMTVEIHRDGAMAVLESSTGDRKVHTRTFYDLRNGKSYTLDLVNTSTPCGAGSFSGDWGDPFALSAELLREMASKNPKTLGTETVAGVTTKVMEVPDPKMTAKVWLDEKDSLVMKLAMAPPGGAAQTMIEVKQFALAKPPTSLFVVPPACAKAASSSQPTEAERISAETGGNAGNYANAIMPPASKNACAVLFKVVEAGTLKPLSSGFQAAIDTQVDVNHMPSYSMGIGQGGRVTFSGGHLHEVTNQMQNGVLHIDNAPPQFNMELAFGQSGDSSALIYRQCYGPETTLLFVVKNRQKLSDGGDWLWVKK